MDVRNWKFHDPVLAKVILFVAVGVGQEQLECRTNMLPLSRIGDVY